MKSETKMRRLVLASTITCLLLLGLFQAAYSQPAVPTGKTVQSNPFESNPTAHDSSGVAVAFPTNSYDGSLDSRAYFKYTVDGYFELKSFNNTGAQFTDIGWVDFKISYVAHASIDDRYRVVYYVGTAGPIVLQDWVYGSAARFDYSGMQAHRSWSNQYESNDGVWDWTDISNVRVVFETDQVSTSDTYKYLFVYEVWLTVYESSFPSAAAPTVSVQPQFVLGLGAGSTFFIDVYAVNVDEFWGYQYKLSYDTTVLTALSFFSYHPFNMMLPSIIDDTAGYVAVAFCSFYGDSMGFTGDTPITRIYFQVDATGTSALDLQNTGLVKTNGVPILHDIVDGFFDNRILAVMATVDIDPDTLNLRSRGQWITAYTQLPEEYSPEDIDASTILLNGTIAPVLDPKFGFVTNPSEYLVDHNNDGILERMVKFNRTMLESYIYNTQGIRYGNVALTITGIFLDETAFEGTDIVFVNYAGDANNDGIIDTFDKDTVYANWGKTVFDPNVDFNNDGAIDTFDKDAMYANWGQTTP